MKKVIFINSLHNLFQIYSLFLAEKLKKLFTSEIHIFVCLDKFYFCVLFMNNLCTLMMQHEKIYRLKS